MHTSKDLANVSEVTQLPVQVTLRLKARVRVTGNKFSGKTEALPGRHITFQSRITIELTPS
jgi:hypothetical protein